MLTLPNSKISSSTPASYAIANKCKTAFVEPPIAELTLIAFNMASFVTMSFIHILFFTRFITALPLSNAILCLLLYTAGIAALPGKEIPMTSAKQHIVFAVPSIAQEPIVGTALFSIQSNSSCVIAPLFNAPSDC